MNRLCQDCKKPTGGPTRCDACEAAYRAPYSTAEYRRAAREFRGRPCAVRLPGCTGVSTTVDHVVPKARGGGRGELRPACAHCNYSRQARRGVGEAMPGGEGSRRDADVQALDRRPLVERASGSELSGPDPDQEEGWIA